PCAPANGLCANAILVSSATTPFSTIGAVTDGPADSPNPPCTVVNQDIWFKYTASCSGTTTVSLCSANYDTAMAVYQGWGCSPLGVRLTCNNDFCGTASQVSFSSLSNGQYLIRVGGNGSASGTGTMAVTCIPTGSGACCMPNHTCTVMTMSQCQTAGGTYSSGQPCSPVTCPPPANDLCANAILVTTEYTAFDTTAAQTDGNVEAGCPAINQDLWYRYNAICDGTLEIRLCEGTAFDAALAVYLGCSCPTSGNLIACDDDGCGVLNGPPRLAITAVNGQCYLIRIGGKGTAAGPGIMHIGCVPTGMGACCHSDMTCSITTQPNCSGSGDIFTAGDICSPAACTAPVGNACAGDMNGDCWVNGNDIPLFVQVLLGNQGPNVYPCRADLNGDGAQNEADVGPFVAKLLTAPSCNCCRGDLNYNGTIDLSDVQLLVNAILTPPSPCGADFWTADLNGDNSVNGLDIQPFVTALINGVNCAP
ncbi:MAG TPA: dockerin type I domain-containing protein, partial [Phycisphaerae bacterium]|nr:dockerin type I domain-containing protein [Phycisphaerae bacterium]